MRKLQLLFLLGSLIFATGCPKYRPKVDFNRNGFVNQVNTFFATKQTEYFQKLRADNPGEAKRIRNELIEAALPYIDEAYMDFITDIQAGRDRGNFVADLIELGTSAAVGITNGERPLQILGVALTAFRGGRRSADLNFYKEQATPVLISKMDGNRAKVRATILTREREEVATYTIGAAIGDIVDYYNAGTLVRAFTELQKDTAVATKRSEDDVMILKGVPLTGEATQPQRDLRVDAVRILLELGRDLRGTDDDKKTATRILQALVTTLRNDATVASVLTNAALTPQSDGGTILTGLIDIRRSATIVNNNALLDKIDQVIVKQGLVAPPTPSPSPTPRPSPSPAASPTASPAASPSPTT
jgi:hypothetical protein